MSDAQFRELVAVVGTILDALAVETRGSCSAVADPLTSARARHDALQQQLRDSAHMTNVLTIASGAVVSSACELVARAPFVVGVPSYAAAGWLVEFGTTLTDSAAFAPLARDDGGLYSIFSGTGGAWSSPIYAPTPYARIRTTNSATTVASMILASTFR